MTLDLTKNPNCYTYYLVRMSPTPEELFRAESVSFEEMQEAVSCAALRAKSTRAQVYFLDRLYAECYTKRQINDLCYNSIKSARNYQTKN